MAFMISMPPDFKVGDTAECTVDGKPTTLTWRDGVTLVIGADDARAIAHIELSDDAISFICADEHGDAPAIIVVPGGEE